MSTPALAGTVQGLKELGIDDLGRFKTAVAAGQQTGWAYYFPYLLSKHQPGRSAVLITEDEGSLCVFRWTAGEAQGLVGADGHPAQ